MNDWMKLIILLWFYSSSVTSRSVAGTVESVQHIGVIGLKSWFKNIANTTLHNCSTCCSLGHSWSRRSGTICTVVGIFPHKKWDLSGGLARSTLCGFIGSVGPWSLRPLCGDGKWYSTNWMHISLGSLLLIQNCKCFYSGPPSLQVWPQKKNPTAQMVHGASSSIQVGPCVSVLGLHESVMKYFHPTWQNMSEFISVYVVVVRFRLVGLWFLKYLPGHMRLHSGIHYKY